MRVIFLTMLMLSIFSTISFSAYGDITVTSGLQTFADDTWTIVSSPARIRTEHLPVMLTATGIMFLPAIADRSFNNSIEELSSRDMDRTYDNLEPFGRVMASYIAGGTVIAGGLISGRDTVTRAGVECMEAALFTVTLTSLLKNASGRLRPGSTTDPYLFYPFEHGNSWPSSHAAQIFSTAAVFSSYTSWWTDMLLYTGASAVAGFDLYDNRHWLSDLTGGAAIGWIIGKAVVRMHEKTSGEQKAVIRISGASPAGCVGLHIVFR